MIVTRGFNSKNIITRGYGIDIILAISDAVCKFSKGIISRVFKRDVQAVLFKKDC